jgi:hypothetical protein
MVRKDTAQLRCTQGGMAGHAPAMMSCLDGPHFGHAVVEGRNSRSCASVSESGCALVLELLEELLAHPVEVVLLQHERLAEDLACSA